MLLAALEPLSCFAGSDEEAALDEDDGALLEPLVEPPAALSFFSVSVAEEELDEDDGGTALPEAEPEVELSLFFDASIDTELDVEPAPEPEGVDGAAELDEAEPDGDAGGVVVELDEEEPAEPDGVVTARSPSRSQPVNMPAPSARETATAKVVSFICYVLRGLGYTLEQQDSGLLH